jgi:hypothetical protein
MPNARQEFARSLSEGFCGVVGDRIESCRDHNWQSGIGFDPLARNVLEFSDHND